MLANSRALAGRLLARGLDLVTGGTDMPLMVVDLRRLGLRGDVAAATLDRAGIACNMNPVPADPVDLKVMSGVRFGVAAGTTRGFGIAEFEEIGDLIAGVIERLHRHPEDTAAVEAATLAKVRELTRRFPIYPDL